MATWRQIDNARLVQRNRLRRLYHSALTTINGRFGKGRIPSTKSIEQALYSKVWRTSVQLYKKSLVDTLNVIEDMYGRPLPVLQKIEKQVSTEDLQMLGLPTDIKLAQTVGMINVKTISKNHHSTLRNIHAKAIQEGLSTGDMAKAFQNGVTQLKNRSLSDATRIAHTETTRIYNQGSLEGYKQSQVVEKKQWMSNMMGNPRHPPESNFDHRGANGEKVAVDMPFVRTGESLMHPGDSAGSVGNVVYCYCGMTPVIGKPPVGEVLPEAPTRARRYGNRIGSKHQDIFGDAAANFSDAEMSKLADFFNADSSKIFRKHIEGFDFGRKQALLRYLEKELGDKVLAKKSLEMFRTISRYTGGKYGTYREAYREALLRKGASLSPWEKKSLELQRILSSGKIKMDTKMYRGMRWNIDTSDVSEQWQAFSKGLIKGEEISLDAFSSFTKGKSIASEFALPKKAFVGNSRSVVLEIVSDGQVRGIDIQLLSSFSKEREILLAGGQKFQIAKLSKEVIGKHEAWHVQLKSGVITKRLIKKKKEIKPTFKSALFEAFNQPLSRREEK